ncbi:MAG: TraR/DksA family transcriptional regulator [Phycisphaerales bacterium]|nr:MAG: TraR/DksA family transcriptional regulator [Phycisphaerales bacterium]
MTGRRETTSRVKHRQKMLRELAAEEVVYVISGQGHSRAVEALEALRRIKDGTYGICVDCGILIPSARLQVKPEATRCIDCQTESERRSTSHQGDSDYVPRRSA